MAPTLPTACGSLHLAGRRSPEASILSPVQTCSSRFGAAGSSPEGAHFHRQRPIGVVSQAPVNQLIYDGLLLLQHTGRIRLFGQSAESLFEAYVAQLVARLNPGAPVAPRALDQPDLFGL
eukprot:gene36683-47819_t